MPIAFGGFLAFFFLKRVTLRDDQKVCGQLHPKAVCADSIGFIKGFPSAIEAKGPFSGQPARFITVWEIDAT